MLKYIKKNVKKVYQPFNKLLGITDTTIKKIATSSKTPNFIKNPLQKIDSYKDTVLHGRNDYQPNARKIIKMYGDKKIKEIKIVRQPIQSFINTAFNALTFGQFQKKLEKLEYDKLFHLRMILTLEDNTQIQLEKNEVINIQLKIDKVKGQEEISVPLNKELTFNQLLEGGKEILKDKYFSYRAFGNNCQDYQIALLKGSDLLNDQLQNFIKQDVEELATINPYLKKIANSLTDLGGKFNEIIHGTGIHPKHSKNYKVQSVLFSKSSWTIPKAKKWLKENNYIYSDVDKKPNTLRFRQFDPDTLNKNIWKYTTHRLQDNIELVIVYKKKSNINRNMKGKGELLHIDINSHNASGKAHNKMEGGKIDLDLMEGGALELEKITRPIKLIKRQDTYFNEPVPSFKKTGKILKTKNKLLNDLTTEDIADLKKIFAEINEEDVKKKKILKKTKKATIKRVKEDLKKERGIPKKMIRGTIEGKRQALKKYKK